MILGVIKINNSLLLSTRSVLLNNPPSTGISPSTGTLLTVVISVCAYTPPITTVPPFSTSTWVLTLLVSMLGTPAYSVPTESLFTLISMMTLSSGVICGLTDKLKVAFLKATFVAPLLLACWYGTSVPVSIMASVLSAVTTRGLGLILPLLSVSSAVNSRDSILLSDWFSKSIENAPAVPADGRFTFGVFTLAVTPAKPSGLVAGGTFAPICPTFLPPEKESG